MVSIGEPSWADSARVTVSVVGARAAAVQTGGEEGEACVSILSYNLPQNNGKHKQTGGLALVLAIKTYLEDTKRS